MDNSQNKSLDTPVLYYLRQIRLVGVGCVEIDVSFLGFPNQIYFNYMTQYILKSLSKFQTRYL